MRRLPTTLALVALVLAATGISSPPRPHDGHLSPRWYQAGQTRAVTGATEARQLEARSSGGSGFGGDAGQGSSGGWKPPKRGRPPGTKNRPGTKKPPGRPPGIKNRPGSKVGTGRPHGSGDSSKRTRRTTEEIARGMQLPPIVSENPRVRQAPTVPTTTVPIRPIPQYASNFASGPLTQASPQQHGQSGWGFRPTSAPITQPSMLPPLQTAPWPMSSTRTGTLGTGPPLTMAPWPRPSSTGGPTLEMAPRTSLQYGSGSASTALGRFPTQAPRPSASTPPSPYPQSPSTFPNFHLFSPGPSP